MRLTATGNRRGAWIDIRIGDIAVKAYSTLQESLSNVRSVFGDLIEDIPDNRHGPPLGGFEVYETINDRPHHGLRNPVKFQRKGYGRVPVTVEADLCRDSVQTSVPEGPLTCSYRLLRFGTKIYIRLSTEYGCKVVLSSVVRDIWRAYVENVGGIIVHASSVELDSRAWLAVGAKDSGKTTTALNLALSGARLIDNDRTALIPSADGLVAMPVPLDIRVGIGTLLSLRWRWRRAAELVGVHERQYSGRGIRQKVSILRDELPRSGIDLSTGAVVGGIIVPSVTPGGHGLFRGQERQSPTRALRRNVYSPRDPGLPDDILLLRKRSAAEIRSNADQILKRLATVPTIEHTWDGTRCSSRSVDRLLASIDDATAKSVEEMDIAQARR